MLQVTVLGTAVTELGKLMTELATVVTELGTDVTGVVTVTFVGWSSFLCTYEFTLKSKTY